MAEDPRQPEGKRPEFSDAPRREPAPGPAEEPRSQPAAKPQDEARPAASRSAKKAKAAQEPERPAAEKEPEAPPRPGRLARLRFSKKKDMPGGLWLKCESCAQVIFRKELEEKGRVCPSCAFHFTLPGKERITATLDEGTWEELFPDIEAMDRLEFQDSTPYSEKVARAVQRTGQKEALLLGKGAVLGRPLVLAILDFNFMGGSMGEVVGEKLALACEVAGREHLPLLIFTASGGARMHEGILSLMQMAKTCAAIQTLNEGGGFSICVMTHPTTGGVTASFASVTDVILAEPGALIGFAGPRVIATTLRQELPPGFQRAEFLLEKGMVDAIVPRGEMRATVARLIDYSRGPRVAADALRPPARDERA